MTGNDDQEELDLGLLAGGVADGGDAGPTGTRQPGDGLSWSWELDIESLLAAITGPAPWSHESIGAPSQPAGTDAVDADAELAEYLEAVEAGRCQTVPLPVVAGRVAEEVPAGPGLAGWLGSGEVGGLEDGALAGMAASYRRLASWAQAGELSVVAELASRSAAVDDRVGVDEHGRPAKVPAGACAEVSLALTMSQSAASWWTDLAVTLRWRLAATGAALAAGEIDLARARVIAEATGLLDEETARLVQDRVLPRAGSQTTAQLRAALRRAVIAADPEGADRRREEAERQAKVMLYPDAEGTASLGGYSLPGIPATAAMARISALARALQASGAGGGIDLLRAHVFIGLLLGTLPYIPPADDAPPDHPPDDEGQPDGQSSRGDPSAGEEPPGGDGPPAGDGPQDGDQPGTGRPGGGTARGQAPAGCPGSDDQHPHHGTRRGDQASQPASHGQPEDRVRTPVDDDDQPGDGGDRCASRDDRCAGRDGRCAGRDSPRGPDPGSGGLTGDREITGPDDLRLARPPPAWPEVPAFLQPGPAAMDHLSPAAGVGGLLDLRLGWAALVGESCQPGYLGRLGPITAGQARHLAQLAVGDPGTRWRIIITDPHGRAVAITGLACPRASRQPGLIKQVTVTIGLDCLAGVQPQPADLPETLYRILTSAQALAAHADRRAAADALAGGGCAHAEATTSYRPTAWLREFVAARDLTCRFPTCLQPVWRCDLDHTTPFDQGGRTCLCNLGGLCRFHHQVKGQTCWHLYQASPGVFTWTTPTGRRYTIQPDAYAA